MSDIENAQQPTDEQMAEMKASAERRRLAEKGAAIDAIADVVFHLSDGVHVLGEPRGVADEILTALESRRFTVRRMVE